MSGSLNTSNDTVDVAQLREWWTSQYGCKPPSRARREFLLLVSSWHAQAKEHGGLKRSDWELIKSLSDTLRQGKEPATRAPQINLTPGTVLMREWNGAHFEVRVTSDGFLFKDRTWKSLSQIAREITGSRWNGPAFFGLRSKRETPK